MPHPALANYATATVDGYTFHVSALGFPVIECTRCDGTGHHSYNPRTGTVCFDCNGKKVRVPKGAAAKEAHAYGEQRRERKQVTANRMEVGDSVRNYHAKKNTPWRKVVAVELTDETCGYMQVGTSEAGREYYYYARVTFEDGETVKGGQELWQRNATVDAAPYAERARRAYVARLRRRGVKPNAEEFAAAQEQRREEERKAERAATEKERKAERAAAEEARDAARAAALKLFDAAKAVQHTDPEMYRSFLELAHTTADRAAEVSRILKS